MTDAPHILIIDDDQEIRYSLQRVLTSRGYRVAEASSGEQGIELGGAAAYEVVFLDNRMGGMGGIETLQHLRSIAPNAMVVLMTAFGTTQTAIEAMKFGAFDYIIKPFDIKKIIGLTEKAVKAHRDLAQARDTQHTPLLNSDDYKEGIVGTSEPMQEVFKMIGQVASSDVTVMVTGESGTGKELVARCIYQHSLRGDRPFMAVNCAAIPDNLIESELFGHEKGAFTGAANQRIGKFELCDGGTLFLDEIGDMALPTQTKILRALQEGEIQRVGGEKVLKVDVRLIAATNKNLEAMVEAKTFREDLYYRLNVMRIRMPSLRDRRSDIPALVDFMLQRLVKSRKTRVRRISSDALEVMRLYDWPGNVRELENTIQRCAVVTQGDTILTRDLPQEILAFSAGQSGMVETQHDTVAGDREPESAVAVLPLSSSILAAESAGDEPIDQVLDTLYQRLVVAHPGSVFEQLERAMAKRALAAHAGDAAAAAEILGISRAAVLKRASV
jgi:DNA-binding NtrC family response regulator